MTTTSLFLGRAAAGGLGRARGTPAALVRARIFDAITRAVAEKGYAATTVSDVTARSRISRRTFYENFAGKEDCFLLAYESASQATLRSIAAATRGVRPTISGDGWQSR